MSALLRLFGIRPDPAPMIEHRCVTCGHVRRWPINSQDPVDAYLSGASVEWLDEAVERQLRREAACPWPLEEDAA